MCCLRRARVNEVGFEIVNTDLESRYRLRRLLVDALSHAPQNKDQQWSRGAESLAELRSDVRLRSGQAVCTT